MTEHYMAHNIVPVSIYTRGGINSRMTPEKALSNTEKENMELYLQACLERRRTFIAMVYSADRISGAESLAAQKRLAALFRYKLKQE